MAVGRRVMDGGPRIGHVALFVASPASSFMTGADLLVDGGYTAV